MSRLQDNHTHTSQQGDGSVGTDLERTKGNALVDASGSTSAGRRRSAGGGAGVSGSGGLSGDGTSAGSTSLLYLRGASTSGGGGSLGAGGTVEATGSGGLALFAVVLVQGESELILDTAHAVGTVITGGTVGVNATAVSVATDDSQELAELGGGKAAVSHASGGIVDAGAQGLINSGGQGRGLGFPGTAVLGGAAHQDGVGGGVGALAGAGRVGTVDLARVVLEVAHLADAGAVHDGHET